ncbi:hypothetical protein [Psychrobacillus phage Perkons]|nr:hypothetical protein [Psychrobacillus phage Perkons]
MRKFRIEKAYLIFDQIFISKELAYKVEDENGIHKDQVREGYYIFEVGEIEGFTIYDDMINVPCIYYRFTDTLVDALQVAKDEEMEL